MELVEGRPLSAQIPHKGLRLTEALKLAVQIASGLEAAHQIGIVHRDLKPANVILTPTSVVKLVDFGLAKLVDGWERRLEAETMSGSLHTGLGQIRGTIAYMSPEQAQAKQIDRRSDLFSFGTLFYEMLTGRRPFRGENSVSTLSAILQQEPTPPSELTAEPLPREVERLVLRCLRKDPNRRYQTTSDLRLALEDINEEWSRGKLGQSTVAPLTRKSRWLWLAVIAVCLAALGGGLWILRPTSSASQQSLQQLTFEAGIAESPAVSPDGKLIAYASDRGGSGQSDIWL
jgi:serine/threonine protein kinase